MGDGLEGVRPGRMSQVGEDEAGTWNGKDGREGRFRKMRVGAWRLTCVGAEWERAGKSDPRTSGKMGTLGGLDVGDHSVPSHQGRTSSGCHQRAEKGFLQTFSREGARDGLVLAEETWGS